MTTVTYEKTKRGEACRKILEESVALAPYKMLTILPIPTTRDGVHITGSDTPLTELLSSAGEGCAVVGYGIPASVTQRLRSLGCAVVDSECDEGFLERNAALTAVATLGIVLSSEERDPSELDIGIVGYGRIGKRLLRLFLSLGSRVRIYTTRQRTALCLADSGVDATDVSTLRIPYRHDLLINTAPSPVLDTGESFPHGMRILELASGDNFHGVSVERCPSLPAKCFPVSAGKAWAESVIRLLGGAR